MPNLPTLSPALIAQMTAWRHDFHAHPETAFEEHRTSEAIATALKNMGLSVHRGLAGTGVVGTLSVSAGPVIGLRADMDALDMTELGEKPHMSCYPGKMHGCGHDGHSAMLLGAAQYLSENKPDQGTVHFIFQPAEENFGGGRRMVEDGLFELFPCDAVYGLHNAPGIALGQFAIREGAMMAASDFFEITVVGKGAHGAHPDAGVDAIVTASQIVLALQTLVSRNVSAQDALVVSVTQIQGGDTWNVLPESVLIRGTCRSFSEVIRQRARRRMKEVCEGAATSSGARVALDYREGYPSVVNADAPTKAAIEAAQSVAGQAGVDTACRLRMGSEDFSYLMQACPGAYIVLGTAKGENDPPVHNPYYDFNDDALRFGAAYWIELAKRHCLSAA